MDPPVENKKVFNVKTGLIYRITSFYLCKISIHLGGSMGHKRMRARKLTNHYLGVVTGIILGCGCVTWLLIGDVN